VSHLPFDCGLVKHAKENQRSILLEAIPISSGIKAPQFTTLHTDWNSNSQNATMTKSTTRVKSGNRVRYVRALAGLKRKGGSALGMAIVANIRCFPLQRSPNFSGFIIVRWSFRISSQGYKGCRWRRSGEGRRRYLQSG
jgi:hypothetical protein